MMNGKYYNSKTVIVSEDSDAVPEHLETKIDKKIKKIKAEAMYCDITFEDNTVMTLFPIYYNNESMIRIEHSEDEYVDKQLLKDAKKAIKEFALEQNIEKEESGTRGLK